MQNLKNDRFEDLKWQLNYVIDQIKLADNKLYFLLAVYMFLFGIMIPKIEKFLNILFDREICLGNKIMIIALFIGVVCFIVRFFICFINGMKPRIQPQNLLKNSEYKSVIFWKDIANMGYEIFEKKWKDEFFKDLKMQIYVNSKIADAKFKWVSAAYGTLGPILITITLFYIFLIILG